MDEREANLRQTALAQAGHDLKGNGSPQDTVMRAQVYFDFLRGAPGLAHQGRAILGGNVDNSANSANAGGLLRGQIGG